MYEKHGISKVKLPMCHPVPAYHEGVLALFNWYVREGSDLLAWSHLATLVLMQIGS